MRSNDETLLGAHLPLPHLGPGRYGTVVGEAWSEALGQVLRVSESRATGSTILLYGEDLTLALDPPTPLPSF